MDAMQARVADRYERQKRQDPSRLRPPSRFRATFASTISFLCQHGILSGDKGGPSHGLAEAAAVGEGIPLPGVALGWYRDAGEPALWSPRNMTEL